jgi:hypothetical protein
VHTAKVALGARVIDELWCYVHTAKVAPGARVIDELFVLRAHS